MKDSTRQGVSLQTKKEEKEAVTDEDEEKFWSAGLFGSGTAKQLLHTIYFYNGKMFGLRGGEHRSICVNNFSLGPNVINFEENVCKTFHGGITDLKYEPRKVRHICHERGQEHDRCLVQFLIINCTLDWLKLFQKEMKLSISGQSRKRCLLRIAP